MRSDVLDYQNLPYQNLYADNEHLNKNSILSLYQDAQYHTYQNITNQAITVQHENDHVPSAQRTTRMKLDLDSNSIKLNNLSIAGSIANGPEDDGLYEICGTQYTNLEKNLSNLNTINNESLNVTTQNSSLNSTPIGIKEYDSKFRLFRNLTLNRISF